MSDLTITVKGSSWARVTRERDEARDLSSALQLKCNMMQDALNEWDNAVKRVEADRSDEVHCGCVPVLRKLLADAREAFAIATSNCVDAQQRLRELNEAREDAKRATYDAAQETIKVSTVKSHWIEACRERDEAREALREIQAADWKTAGELRGMARTALEAAK